MAKIRTQLRAITPCNTGGGEGRAGPEATQCSRCPSRGGLFAGAATSRRVNADRDTREQEGVQDRVAILKAGGDDPPDQRILVGCRRQAVQALALLP